MGRQHCAAAAPHRRRAASQTGRTDGVIFFVTGQIYVDTKAPADLRAAAQGFIAFVTLGVGMFIGSWLSGLVVDRFSSADASGVQHAWRSIWLVPAAGAAAVLLLFALFFGEGQRRPHRTGARRPVERT